MASGKREQSGKKTKRISILSKLFWRKTDSKECKKSSCGRELYDENGNAKASPEGQRISQSSANVEHAKRKGFRYIFRRKKQKEGSKSNGSIYVELTPTKSTATPDLLRHDICASSLPTPPDLQQTAQEEIAPRVISDAATVKSSKDEFASKAQSNSSGDKISAEVTFYDCATVCRQQTKKKCKISTNNNIEIRRAHSYSFSDNHKEKSSESTHHIMETEEGLSPSDYAKMCRQSNHMLQSFTSSGTKKKRDRSFLRWHSVADLPCRISKESFCEKDGNPFPSLKVNCPKSISLQDLSAKTRSQKKSECQQTADFYKRVVPPAPEVERIKKISRPRPSLDKALSKSEYDLRSVHQSSSNRGILAFKKVNLPNVQRRSRKDRPVSEIIPYHFQTNQGYLTNKETVTEPFSGMSFANYDYRSSVQANNYYASSHMYRRGNSKRGSAERPHSLHENSLASFDRSMPCDVDCFPSNQRVDIRQNMLPHGHTVRSSGISRSRSRVRSIAKRYNLSGSNENLSPSKFSVCKANNWRPVDLDGNSEYCIMKPLAPDNKKVGVHKPIYWQSGNGHAVYPEMQRTSTPMKHTSNNPQAYNVTYCHGNAPLVSSHSEWLRYRDGYRQTTARNHSANQRVYYALDV